MSRASDERIHHDEESSRGCCNGFFGSVALKRSMTVIGILVALGVGVFSIIGLIVAGLNLINVLFCIYQVIFAFMLILAEFKFQFFIKWFLFLGPYVGLGLFYIFVAVFTFSHAKWWQFVVGAVCAGVGFIYIMMGIAKQDRGIHTETIDRQKARDKTVSYAVSKGSEHNTAANRAAVASAALEEGRHQNNPFENDNPFEKSSGRSAYN